MRIVEFDELDVSRNREQLEKRLASQHTEGANQGLEENKRDEVRTDLMDTVENAVTLAGYEVLGTEGEQLIVRHGGTDRDFSVTIEEVP